MSKQFVNDVVSVTVLAPRWHEVPLPPLEGEVVEQSAKPEGFVRQASKKTPQTARSGCQLPFQGSQGGFAARVAKLATPTGAFDCRGIHTFVTHAIAVPGKSHSGTQWAPLHFGIEFYTSAAKPNSGMQVVRMAPFTLFGRRPQKVRSEMEFTTCLLIFAE